MYYVEINVSILFVCSKAVQEAGEKLMGVSNVGVQEIEARLQQLGEVWSQLKAMTSQRGQKLEQSLIYQQFLAKVRFDIMLVHICINCKFTTNAHHSPTLFKGNC